MNDITLGISSYSNFLKITLYDNKKYLNYSRRTLNLEDVMFEEINKMLIKFNAGFRDIKRICIVKGPGRFTGIRSAYCFASVYNAVSKVELYGVSIFELLVYNVFERDRCDGEVFVITNAFKEEYYLMGYKITGSRIIPTKGPLWLFKDELLKKIKGFDGLVITDDEDNDMTYKMLSGFKKADLSISRVIPENIIKAALFFKNKDIEPLYLKPAKFEL